MTTTAANALLFKTAKSLGTKQEAYYDRTTWNVEFRGQYDGNRVYDAIRARVCNAFVQLSSVKQVGPTTVEYVTLYNIGD